AARRFFGAKQPRLCNGWVYVKQHSTAHSARSILCRHGTRRAAWGSARRLGARVRDLGRRDEARRAMSGVEYLNRQAEAAYELYRAAVTKEGKQAAWRQFVALSHQAEVAKLYR